MNGTEKQIQWAENIKNNLIPEIDELVSELHRVEQSIGNDGDETTWKLPNYSDDIHLLRINLTHGKLFAAINAIKECQEAKWFINFGRNGARYAVHAAISGNKSLGGLI